MNSSLQQLDTKAEDDAWARRNELLTRLIARARTGDVAAFEELYDATGSWLLARIRRTVQDGQAEDVLAEVYLKVWRSLESYDQGRSPPAVWLAVIARSTSVDHLRKEKSRGHSVSADCGDATAVPEECHADGPEQHLSRSQDCALVRLSMDSLGPSERMVIGLTYFHECTQQEVSARTGLPMGTVKALVRSAREKLRALLQAPAAQSGSTISVNHHHNDQQTSWTRTG